MLIVTFGSKGGPGKNLKMGKCVACRAESRSGSKFWIWRALTEISAIMVPKFGLYCIFLRETFEKYYGGNV